MKTLLLMALLWGNSPDNALSLGNQIAIQADCSYDQEKNKAYIYDCGQYMTFSTFKIYMSTFIMSYSDIKQVLPWQVVENNGRAIVIQYDQGVYGIIYNETAKLFVIQYFGEA